MEFQTLEQAIAYYAKIMPDKVCIIEAENGHKVTYAEFWKMILSFGKRLQNIGLQKGDRVLVQGPKTINMAVAAFGIHMAGGIYVPITQRTGKQRILELLKSLAARFFIAEEQVECECIYIDLNSVCDDITAVDENKIIFPNPDDVCNIFHTTGTTGVSKSIMREYRSHTTSQRCWQDAGDDILISANMQSGASEIGMYQQMFTAGGTIVLTNSGLVNDFFSAIKKYSVTVFNLNPAILSMMLKVKDDFKRCCSKLHHMVIISGATPVIIQQELKKALPNTHLYIAYGANETMIMCMYEFSKYDVIPFCVGRPVSNMKVYVVNENGEKMEYSDRNNLGYIVVEGSTVMKGYWNDLELTSRVLKDGKLSLADVGYKDENGLLYIMGRKDDVINMGGKKIAPEEVEEITMEIPGIKECACVPEPNEIFGNITKLFVVMEENEEFSANKIREHLCDRLEYYKIPKKIEQINTIPRTDYGIKIRRRDLR